MNHLRNLCIVLLLAALTLSSCKSSSREEPPSEQELRIEYLQNTTTEVSIDPSEDGFSDLEGLGRAVGDARVVALGEATHGEGNVFEAKTRIIEYLITEKNFEIVAFESPIYDVYKAQMNINAGGGITSNLENSLYTIWMNSSNFQPMMNLLEQFLSDQNIEIAGVDSDFFELAGNSLVADLKEQLDSGNIDMETSDWQRFETLLQHLVDNQWQETSMTEDDRTLFDDFIDNIHTYISENSGSVFWPQMVLSVGAEADRKWISKNGGPNNGTGGLRDLQMGDNLVWLAEEFYPDKKIIIWAANIHNARDMSEVIAPDDPDFSFADFETMGKVAASALQDDYYTISFTGLNGEWARWFDVNSTSVSNSSEGSIEYLLGETGRNHAFIDLRNPGNEGTWLNERLLAKPFGYVELEANWPQVTDGIFFVRTIAPVGSN